MMCSSDSSETVREAGMSEPTDEREVQHTHRHRSSGLVILDYMIVTYYYFELNMGA